MEQKTENNAEGNGITFGEILRLIGRRVWYVIAVPVAFAIVVTLLFGFLINPRMATYTAEFVIVNPMEDTMTYPDGGPFFYQDIVSAEALTTAKSSDESFAYIDVNRMSKQDDITVIAEQIEQNGVKKDTGRYFVTVKGDYFTGSEQAEAFLHALAEVPIDRMREIADGVEFATDKTIFDSASFEEQLNLLAGDKSFILQKYDEWIGNYSGEYAVTAIGSDGASGKRMKLKDFRAEVTALYGESTQKELESELEIFGYYKGDDLEGYAARLHAEYVKNKQEIEELQKYLSATTTTSERLTYLVGRNSDIKTWVGEAYAESGEGQPNGTLNKTNVDAFAARVQAERDKIEEAAETLTAVTRGIYRQGMTVRFDTHVDKDGGVSLVLVAAGSLLLALLLVCIVVCCVERSRDKKKAEAPKGAPSEDAEVPSKEE